MLVFALFAGCGEAADAEPPTAPPTGACRSGLARLPPPSQMPAPAATALTGLGATWRDWVATHEQGYERCDLATDRPGHSYYTFEPDVEAGIAFRAKYDITAMHRQRVTAISIGFREGRFSRDGPDEHGNYDRARREVLAELPDDAALLATYKVVEPEGSQCLVQAFESRILQGTFEGRRLVVAIYSTGSEAPWDPTYVDGVTVQLLATTQRITSC